MTFLKLFINFIKEYIEHRRNQKKLNKMYNGNIPKHFGCESVKKSSSKEDK
jgi:hypothetical protein